MTESGKTSLVVCGAHLSGMPLNKQLTARGATLEQVTRTAALYRLFALPGEPRRPGLVRVEQDGRAILVEVWSMPTNQLGSFLALIPAPLGLGKVRLADGSEATGFICEGIGIVGAEDVSAFGGWRAYMAHCQKNPTAGNRPAVVERKINIKALPRDAELTLSDCALLIIDMQRDFIEPGGFGEALGNDVSLLQSAVGPCRALLSAARRAGIPVLHTREGHAADLVDLHEEKWLRGPRGKRIGDAGPMGRILIRGEAGHDFIDDLQPVAGETVIDKPGKGAFYQTPLHPLLQQLQVQTLIVCGVTTEVCVHTTVREANDRGYRVIVPADCCASYFPEFHRVGLEMIAAQGGIFGYVCQSSALLSALAGSALGKEGGH